jgi:hypothetical protein
MGKCEGIWGAWGKRKRISPFQNLSISFIYCILKGNAFNILLSLKLLDDTTLQNALNRIN